MKKTAEFTFFWKDKDCFSNWYMSEFTQGDITFNCSEQAFMYHKALLFDDKKTAEKVLNTKHPRDQKALGREVKNFDSKIWDKISPKVMYEVNELKFSQNPDLYKQLMETGDTELVEASPKDKVWGIGLEETHPDAENKLKWRGRNLLGQVLTELREEFKKQNS